MGTLIKFANHHFQYKILLQQDRTKIWNYLIEVPSWKKWDTELKSSRLKSTFVVDGKGVIRPKNGPRMGFRIIEMSEGDSYTFKANMFIGYLVVRRSLLSSKDGYFFTDDVKLTGVFKHVLGLFLGPRFKKVLPIVMYNFKTQVESL